MKLKALNKDLEFISEKIDAINSYIFTLQEEVFEGQEKPCTQVLKDKVNTLAEMLLNIEIWCDNALIGVLPGSKTTEDLS